MVGIGMSIVGGGGSVGGITVGGMLVGGTAVGATDVRVGFVRVGTVRVDVGRPVGEEEMGVVTAARVRWVAVDTNVRVGVGVRVSVGVAVGMVDVTVGGSVGVRVGAVEVGKGPISAWEVRASAVLVLRTPCRMPRSSPGSLNANQKYRITPRKRTVRPTARRSICLFKVFNANNSFQITIKDNCCQKKFFLPAIAAQPAG